MAETNFPQSYSEHLARLRFFITSRHSEEQLRFCADTVAEELAKLNPAYLAPPDGPVAISR